MTLFEQVHHTDIDATALEPVEPRALRFTVFGDAKPAGSKNAFKHPATGRIIVTDSSGKAGKSWRREEIGRAHV